MHRFVRQWKSFSTFTTLLLVIYALGFLEGGVNHWIDIVNLGLFPYKNIPFIYNFYLTSLAVIDLIVIVLLFTSPIYGLMLAFGIMASDLAIDFYLTYAYWNSSFLENWQLQILLIFGLFIFVSTPFLLLKISSYNRLPTGGVRNGHHV